MPSRRQFLRTSTAALLGGSLASPSALPAAEPTGGGQDEGPTLTPDKASETYNFQTSQISGSIRAEGSYHGVSRLGHRKTGVQVIDPRYSALNLFRLFSTNLGMGTPRAMERKIEATANAVEIHWPATEAHQGQITARYQPQGTSAVDLTVTVKSLGTYPGYEILLCNYFDKTLVPYVSLKPSARGGGGNKPDLVVPMVSDVVRGGVLQFPRDVHSARKCLDGRWNRSEYKMPTVPFYPVRRYGHCMAFVSDPRKRLAAVLMADPRDCFAISARYFAQREEDRLTSYTAFDFSLFGDDLTPGQQRTARVRLALAELDGGLSRPVELYKAFIDETGERAAGPRSTLAKEEPNNG